MQRCSWSLTYFSLACMAFPWAEMLKAKNWVTFWHASWQSGLAADFGSRLSSGREKHSQQGPAWLSDTSQWGLGPESQVPRGITCFFTLPCSLCSTILGITHGEVAGSTDFGSWTRIIESPHPSWDSSHGTVRGYGNRQTYLPVQDLALVCSFVSWVTSSKCPNLSSQFLHW